MHAGIPTRIRHASAHRLRDYDFNATGSFQVNERVYPTQDAVFNVTSLVTRYTIGGDGDGDGSVNVFDLTIMSAHWQQYVSGGAVNGDFNNDGFVNAFDSNILSVNWNSTGNTATWIVTQRHAYASYGQVQTMKQDWTTRSDYLAWNYTFQGGWQDLNTGLINFQMRDYNPRTYTWNTQDPLGFVDGMNRYQFTMNNSVKGVDPKGQKTIVVAFSGLDFFGNPGSKWITSWRPQAINAGKDVQYLQYSWTNVEVALNETITELTTPISGDVLNWPSDASFARPGCVYNTVVVLGHSFGGDAAHKYINRLREKDVGVDEVVTADPRHFPGIPPLDIIPFRAPANIFRWENFYQRQQWFPIELFGAEVHGDFVFNTELRATNGESAHFDIPTAPMVLAAITNAVRSAGEYRMSYSAWKNKGSSD